MNILTDPTAPHRPADPHSALETRLMQAALHDKADDHRGPMELPTLIPDHPDRMACNSPVTAGVHAAIERITGKALPPLAECNAPRARSELKRWAVRWNGYLRS